MSRRWPRLIPPGWWWLAMLPLAAGLLALGGCGDPGTGPAEVKWDRVTCDRCRMVLSARHYAAQIRAFTAEGKSSLHYFDDIGCALIWLDQQPWRDDPRTQVWVNDWRSGLWIDARTAHYLPVKETPMRYGLGAQPEPAPGAMDFNAAKRHVYAVEEGYNAPIYNDGAPGTAPDSARAGPAPDAVDNAKAQHGDPDTDSHAGALATPQALAQFLGRFPKPATRERDLGQPHPAITL